MIQEVTRSGRRIPIHNPLCDSAHINERVNAEVARDSRIEVRFLRDAFVPWPTDLEIMVRGRLIGEGTDKPIEIPNYALVGQERQPATASVQSRNTIAGIVSGLLLTSNRVEHSMNALAARANNAQAAEIGVLHREIVDAEIRAALLQANYTEQRRRYLELNREVQVLQDSAPAAPRLNMLMDSLRLLQRELHGDSTAVATIQNTIQTKSERVRDLEGQRGHATFLESSLPQTRAQLLDYREMLTAPLTLIADSANRRVVSAITDTRVMSPVQISQIARDIVDVWFPRLADDNQRGSHIRTIQQIQTGLRLIVGGLEGADSVSVRRSLLSAIKDTDILVNEIGAQSGNTLVLTITNLESSPADRRDLTVRLRVADLGWSASVGEAFTLINRTGTPSAAENQQRIDRFRQSFAARPLYATLITADSVMVVQQRHRWRPSYSFTSGWVYRGRAANPLMDANRWNWWHDAMHWLQPSIGVQVALPSFGTQQVTFRRLLTVTPDTADDGTIGADTTFSVSDPVVTDLKPTVDVAMGGYVGFWNNMVVVGTGSHLTSDEPRWYVSLGVSFVRIAQAAIQSLSTTQ